MNVRTVLILLAIVLLGGSLRVLAISNTVVDHPVRADARIYYFAALNLERWGVFSRAEPTSRPPEPDAFVPPGLPLAIMPFVEFPPSDRMLFRFNSFQVLLSVLTIVATFGLFRLFAGESVALLAAFMVAISPHLIVMTTYLLTETQFTFLLLCGVTALGYGLSRERWGWAIVGGVLLGLSALTRATTEYFPIFLLPFLFWSLDRRQFFKLALPAVISALLVIGAWKLRNLHALGSISDPTLFVNTLLHGMYPDFMYEGMPASRGRPYAFDPFALAPHDAREVIQELLRRATEHPLAYLYWFLIGKPLSLLSWDIVAGAGGIFVYPVVASPYFDMPVFQVTQAVSLGAHIPLTAAAVVGCGLVLMKAKIVALSDAERRVAVLVCALILYFVAVHMVGAPFPRYGIPLRPVVYGLGLYTLVLLGRKLLLPAILIARARLGRH